MLLPATARVHLSGFVALRRGQAMPVHLPLLWVKRTARLLIRRIAVMLVEKGRRGLTRAPELGSAPPTSSVTTR